MQKIFERLWTENHGTIIKDAISDTILVALSNETLLQKFARKITNSYREEVTF